MITLIRHGTRLLQSQKRALLQKRSTFSSATAAADLSHEGKTFTVSYLIGSLGFTTKLAESISRKVSFENKTNADSVLSLLRSHGFKDSQISNIIRVYPQLLTLDAESSIGPKLKFLKSREGVSTSELTEILSTVPKIFGIKKEKAISVYYDFVKEIIEADKSSEFVKLPLEGSSKEGNKMRNVLVLRELGVAQRLLFPLLMSDSHPVLHGKERFEESVKKVVEMGFDPTSSKFVDALRVLYNLSDETIAEKVGVCEKLGFGVSDVWGVFKKWPLFMSYSEKKITQTFETLKKCGLVEHEVLAVLKKHPKCVCSSEEKIVKSVETFVSLGFSREDFVMMVKRYPQCIDYTGETVKKKTEFIVEKMNWSLEDLVLIPQVFGYSLEKRTVPRCKVIKTLIAKGLMGNRSEMPPMSSVLTSTNQAFLSRYVLRYEEMVPELMAIFNGDCVS